MLLQCQLAYAFYFFTPFFILKKLIIKDKMTLDILQHLKDVPILPPIQRAIRCLVLLTGKETSPNFKISVIRF